MSKSKAASLQVQEKINIKSFGLPWCYKNKLILRNRLRTLADMIDWEVTLEIHKKINRKDLIRPAISSLYVSICNLNL